jgi:NTP pyrophosphatase (non-canonical NTP hydrolase)
MEIGWALAFCKPILYQEKCAEELFTGYGEVMPSPNDVHEFLQLRETIPPNTICRRTPVDLLQRYIHKVVVKRGFDKETPRDVLLLMLEEVGELAKAIRKFSGLKVDPKKASTRGNLEEELADVFIYLLDLANGCNVDLFSAFHKKEMENEKRSWSVQKNADQSSALPIRTENKK